MRSPLLGLAVAAALAMSLTACSSDDDTDAKTDDTPSSSPAPAETSSPAGETPDAATDDREFPGGQPLSSYEGQASYPWRVNIVDNQDVLLPAMQGIAPHLDEGDFGDVVSTCDNLAGGADRAQVDANAVTRFSGGSDEQVSPESAAALVDLSIQFACPDLG